MSKEKETISFRTPIENKEALDSIATLLNRDRSYVINQAVRSFIELYDWQVEHIKEGLKEANQGNFASEKELSKVISKWKK